MVITLVFLGRPAFALDSKTPIGFLFIHNPEIQTAGTQEGGKKLDPLSTGTILFAKQAAQPFAPGSLAKVMTVVSVVEAINAGDLRESQRCPISVHAWRTGGAPAGRTTMFAEVKSEIPIKDLLLGLIVHSANDAAIALAECIDGSEPAFAKRMNAVAAKVGLTDSHFVNPTGYGPEEAETGDEQKSPQSWGHTSARDMARLGIYLLEQHEPTFKLFAQPDFTWNKIFQRNKNPLLGDIRGLDGLGAGQSEEDGFSGLGTIVREGRRYVAVVAGAPSGDARNQAMKDLMDDALQLFANQRLFEKGETIADARVYGGMASTVPLVAEAPINVLLPRSETLDYRIRVVYSGPLKAPVEKGRVVGEIRVLGADDTVVHRQQLVTDASVSRGDMTTRALSTLREILFGWL